MNPVDRKGMSVDDACDTSDGVNAKRANQCNNWLGGIFKSTCQDSYTGKREILDY